MTLALGRMVQDLEISAMRTHGLSHTQLLVPVFVLAYLPNAFVYSRNIALIRRRERADID